MRPSRGHEKQNTSQNQTGQEQGQPGERRDSTPARHCQGAAGVARGDGAGLRRRDGGALALLLPRLSL